MPWVRLDEHAMEHPKVAGLPDGAFRLWVSGLSYCQKFLTDGFISDAALRGLRGYSPKRRDEMVVAGLWDAAENGVQVHDYLDWNESRKHVLNSREQAKERLKKHREKRASNDAPNSVANAQATVTGVIGSPQVVVPLRSEGGLGETNARSRRPIFKGRSFVVFEWQLDDLRRMLGAHTEGFDLHAWFDELDERADKAAVVIPQRDGGKWLQEQTLNEAVRRGLPVASTAASVNPKTAGNQAAAARFVARGQR